MIESSVMTCMGWNARRVSSGVRRLRWVLLGIGWFSVTAWAAQPSSLRYDALPVKVAQSMLLLANTGAGDIVYDFGCRDGDIVVTAAHRFGAHGVCVSADSRRIAEIQEKARGRSLGERIRFVNEDVRRAPIGDATVVMLRLSPALTRDLRARLLGELKPGTLVVSYQHDMGDWLPDLTAYVRSGGEDRPIYLWTVPAR